MLMGFDTIEINLIWPVLLQFIFSTSGPNISCYAITFYYFSVLVVTSNLYIIFPPLLTESHPNLLINSVLWLLGWCQLCQNKIKLCFFFFVQLHLQKTFLFIFIFNVVFLFGGLLHLWSPLDLLGHLNFLGHPCV